MLWFLLMLYLYCTSLIHPKWNHQQFYSNWKCKVVMVVMVVIGNACFQKNNHSFLLSMCCTVNHLYIGSFALSLYQRMRAGLSPVWAYDGVQLQGIATPSPITPTTSCLTTAKTSFDKNSTVNLSYQQHQLPLCLKDAIFSKGTFFCK